jgi:hypothetical protein
MPRAVQWQQAWPFGIIGVTTLDRRCIDILDSAGEISRVALFALFFYPGYGCLEFFTSDGFGRRLSRDHVESLVFP